MKPTIMSAALLAALALTSAPSATWAQTAPAAETPAAPAQVEQAKPEAPAAETSAPPAAAAQPAEAPAAGTAATEVPATETQASEKQAAPAAAAPVAISAADLKIGTPVTTTDGEVIGVINRVGATAEGAVTEVEVALGNKPGLKAKTFTIPADKVSVISGNVGVKMSADEARKSANSPDNG